MPADQRVSPYDYSFDPGGPSTAARVCRLVGRERRVLEVGCGYGVISRQLSHGQGCAVTGVEYDRQSAEAARPWLNQLVVADLEKTDWVEAISGRFDVVIAADVIEHLRDPLHALGQFRQLMAEQGELVLSVPNIGHAGVLAELLCGDFSYRDTGILDRTHLRFYTWRSLEAQLNEAGFEVVHREAVNAPGSHEQFFHHWVKLPASVREALDGHPLAQVFQYVLKARRSERPVRLAVDDADALDAWLNRA